ncbi:aminotransferase class V-fold PLP-dependent enzyme [Candidatus Dojkabacteria bacterium]|uniref:Aminotransferase class V-fold PLP-dependent enzyme n=1 Tax=Candidatus Dojkabacteria bacterium TaxID=2099670 RepID=A0A955KVR3_9BACT|nr:aminotransferase class V-fold PLP-dependent enzyme [Candidatus Dojkabacteria bacterium]
MYFPKEPSSSERIFITKNGSSAIYLFLKSLNLPEDSEVILQAFTCNSVVNPVLWAGFKPVYSDIDRKTFSIDIESLKSRVTDKTKVVILQHTFGIPGPVHEVVEFCRQKKIFVLEDCAHALGVEVGGRPLGISGDAAIVSFGLEKTLSTKVGGALLLNNKNIAKKINTQYGSWKYMSYPETFIWLLNPIIRIILRKIPIFRVSTAVLLSRVGLFNTGFVRKELKGEMPSNALRLLPGVLASVVVERLARIEYNLRHRENITQVYLNNVFPKGISIADSIRSNLLPLVKFPVVTKDEKQRDEMRTYLQSEGIYISDWYDPVVYPEETDLKLMRYVKGSCPVAEDISKRVINLPTGSYVTTAHAKMICHEIENFTNSK